MKRSMRTTLKRVVSFLLAGMMLASAFPLGILARTEEDVLDEIRNYDALYDKTNLVLSYDFTDVKEGAVFPSGSTVSFDSAVTSDKKLTLSAIKDTLDYERMYGDGYLLIGANNRLTIPSVVPQNGSLTVTTNFAYAENSATPVAGTAASSTYGEDFLGAISRDTFKFGGLTLSTSYLSASAKAELLDMISEYQRIEAEYNKFDINESADTKDAMIAFLQTCEFVLPNGLHFSDVYYLLHPELQNLVPWTPDIEEAAMDAKWYTYLTYDAEFYEVWKNSGIVSAKWWLAGGNANKADFYSPDFSLLETNFYDSIELAIAISHTANKSELISAWRNAQNVNISGSAESTSAPSSDLVFFEDTAAKVYTIRVYDGEVSDAQLRQNHFADIASFHELNTYYFLKLTADEKTKVYNAFAGVSMTDLTAKEAQALLDTTIEELDKHFAYEYDMLYVTDIDGDGESDIVFDWDAFGMTAEDNADNGKVPTTVLTDKLGTTFNISSNAEYGDGYLHNAASAIDISACYPSHMVGEAKVPDDMYLDMTVAYNSRVGDAGRISTGPQFITVYTYLNDNYKPHSAAHGPVSGTWCNYGSYSTDQPNPRIFGNPLKEPFRVGILVDTTINEETLTDSTFITTYYRDGKVAKTINEQKFNPAAEEVGILTGTTRLVIGYSNALDYLYYSIRVYTKPLSEEQAEQNRFADCMKFYGLDPVLYIAGSEEQREKVQALLADEVPGKSLITAISNKYEAIFSASTNMELDDLYLKDKLVFDYNAFDKTSADTVGTLVDKNGVAMTPASSAELTYGDGCLVLGDKANGAITLKGVLPAASYTVQLLMAYRSDGTKGYNAGAGDVSRDTFRFGALTVGNVMNSQSLLPIKGTQIQINGTRVGLADAYGDLNNYGGKLLTAKAGEVFEFTTVVNATTSKMTPAFYRDGELVFDLPTADYTASKDIVIGDYADLEIYAIRIYAQKLGEDIMAQNHFADLMNYYKVDMAAFNLLSGARRIQLYTDFADVSLEETSGYALAKAIDDSLAEQLSPDVTAENYMTFDGYSVCRLVTGLRAQFTISRDTVSSSAIEVKELGVLLSRDGHTSFLHGEKNALSVSAETERIVFYNGTSYDAVVSSDGKVTVEVDFNETDYTDTVAYRHYALVSIPDPVDPTEYHEVLLYGDMNSELFGEEISMNEVMACLSERGHLDAGGMTPVANELSDGASAKLTELLAEIEAIADTINGTDSYLKNLMKEAQTALEEALTIKEGSKPSNVNDVQAYAEEAKSKAMSALGALENDAQTATQNAKVLLVKMKELCAGLKAAEVYGKATADMLVEANELLAKATAICESQIVDLATLTASTVRNAAVLANKALTKVKNNEYGATEYLKVLYIGDITIESVVEEILALGTEYGYDDIIFGNLNIEGGAIANAKAAVGGKVTGVYRKSIGGEWFTASARTLEEAVLDEEWAHIIVSPDMAMAATSPKSDFATNITALVNGIKALSGKASLYYMQGYAPSERQSLALYGESSPHDGKDAERVYETIIAYAKAVPKGLFKQTIPTATLIQNMRSGLYGEALFSYLDGYKLNPTASYAVGISMLQKMDGKFDFEDVEYLAEDMISLELDWIEESCTAATRYPNILTQASYVVHEGVKEDDDVMVIYGVGQSNMANGPVFTWLQTYMTTRNPGKQFVILNKGLGGETIFETLNRTDFVIASQPDVVILHYGVYNYMGSYILNGTITDANVQENLQKHESALIEAVTKYRDAGIDVILSAEGVSYNRGTNGPKLNAAMEAVTAINHKVMNMTNEDGSRRFPNFIAVIDTTAGFTAMAENDATAKNSGVIFGSDYLHFANSGGAAYSYLFSQYVGDAESNSGIENFVSEIVADVTLKQDGTSSAINATVSNLTVTSTSVSYKYKAQAIPLPVNSDYQIIDKLNGFDMANENKEIIRAEGLASGNYVLKIDGITLGTYSADELAAGVNIAENPSNPAQAQAKKVYEYATQIKEINNNVLLNLHYDMYKFYNEGFIDVEGNYLYSQKLGRYYNDDDIRDFLAKNYPYVSGNLTIGRLYAYLNDNNPANSLLARKAQSQFELNKCLYLAKLAATPTEHTIAITPAK